MKLKIWSSLATALFAISLCGCMKIKPKNEEASEDNTAQVGLPPGKIDVSYPSQGPNEYSIKFQFQGAPATIFITKTIGGIKNSEWIQLRDQTWIDEKVKPGDEIHYEFGTYNQNHFEPWDQIDAKVPKDLVIDRALDFAHKEFRNLFVQSQGLLVMKQFTRIYFTNSGAITLEGQAIQIEAQELHSDHGLIQTFSRGANGPSGKPGRAGGLIDIKVASATGVLKLEMRGEGGGDGLPAPLPDLALKGATGSPGEPGTRGREYTNGTIMTTVTCERQPGRGLPGYRGLKGYPGGNGQRGGSSGQLLVTIKNGNNFSLLATSEVGQGGIGAKGGAGGGGGDGGPAGALPPARPAEQYSCDQFLGAPGDRGDLGDPGGLGADGEKQAICETKNQQPKVCY